MTQDKRRDELIENINNEFPILHEIGDVGVIADFILASEKELLQEYNKKVGECIELDQSNKALKSDMKELLDRIRKPLEELRTKFEGEMNAIRSGGSLNVFEERAVRAVDESYAIIKEREVTPCQKKD